VAAAASTVTITEVEGKQAQKAWQSFCRFCDKALPSLNMFLKLSVPILTTLISSIANPQNKLENKLRLQWFTLRFRMSRSIHWSFWETLGLPMTSEVSGRYRTRDLAGIWWIHG
jgi:hypothetical protein